MADSSPRRCRYSADPGQLSGHYIETSTNREGGGTVTNHWFFGPCGHGCASVQVCDNEKHEGCTSAQARLVKGRWEMDVSHLDIACPNSAIIPDATDFHYTWNPDTLEGVGGGNPVWSGLPGGYHTAVRDRGFHAQSCVSVR